MKLKLLFYFFSLSFLGQTQACSIATFDQIIKIDKIINDQIFKSTNCSEEIQNKFLGFINNANGVLNGQSLASILEINELHLTPTRITITSMEEFLKSQSPNKLLVFKNIHSLLGAATLNLNSTDKINLTCNQCQDLGRRNIKLTINSKEVWLTADIGKEFKVLTAKRSISPLETILNDSDFEYSGQTLFKKTHEFTNIDNIKFFRLNKSINKGDILKDHDLSPKQIIQYGQKVQVSLKSEKVQLKTVAKAKKSGRYGEFIELQNPKSKKTYLGKIVDYNKVEVEL